MTARGICNIAGSLEHADLSDIIAGRPEAEALCSLRVLSEALGRAQLRTLNLSDNALGEKGVRACAAAISGQVLRGAHRQGPWLVGLASEGLAFAACLGSLKESKRA